MQKDKIKLMQIESEEIKKESEEIKMSYIVHEMIFHIKNTKKKKANEKYLQIVSDYGKAIRYKVNIQMSIAFLYTSNETLESELLRKWYYLQKLQNNEILRYK